MRIVSPWRWQRKQGRLLAVVLALVWMGPGVRAARGEEGMFAPAQVSWSPKAPKQGDVVHLRVNAPEGVSVAGGEMLSKALLFSPSPEGPGRWDALFGIDMGQKPGDYEVRVRLAAADGSATRDMTASIRIEPQAFGEERLTLPDSKVHLSAADLERVKKERVRIASLWSRVTPERLWDGPFLVPVEGRPGSPFGLKRWINGERRSPHTGMDIKAPEGSPVVASNSGRVVLVGDFFFSGRAVFLDHGQGVYTMYFHLSKINVVEGQKVARGQVLGLVGMTGRATGPHLHWGVRLGGSRVDPTSLVKQTHWTKADGAV